MRIYAAVLALTLTACSGGQVDGAMPMTEEALNKVNAALDQQDVKGSLQEAGDDSPESAMNVLASAFNEAFDQSGYDLDTTFVTLRNNIVSSSEDEKKAYLNTASVDAIAVVVRLADLIDNMSESPGVELADHFSPDAVEALKELSELY